MDELNTRNLQMGADIICITETWLKDHIEDNVIALENFHPPIRRDRKDIIGGGVCCYVRSSFQYKIWDELSDPELETV